ncbi:MAG: alkaline phosphatase D [Flavobacteriales bacterium]|jgi:alkaline phosphatase D
MCKTAIMYLITGSCAICLMLNIDAQNTRSFPCEDLYPFYHGVASGDPLEDRVIIWTRVSPNEGQSEIEVEWRMALDTGMINVVATGSLIAHGEIDYTVKIDVDGLDSDTWYYYDFKALGLYSLRGRTRTLPIGPVDRARFAVMSCSNYEHGYFNAYKLLAHRNDFDAVIHLGDYIYEYEVGGFSAFIDGRQNVPVNEVIQLEDYRLRHSHYKLDADLRLLHQHYPFITVWDDHEFANDAWTGGASNHNPGEGDWSDRKNNGWQAYFEWMPVRDLGDNVIRRTIDWGELARLYMLDTRIEGRDEQVEIGSDEIASTSRTLLGEEQKEWLSQELQSSTAQWNLFGQQVMMAPITLFGLELNTDQWDGYQGDRNWFYSALQGFDISNPVILTGDIHTAWANNLPLSDYDESSETGSLGVEFVVTSVTSQGSPIDAGTSIIQLLNPHVEYIDLTAHGYIMLDVTTSKVQGDYHYVENLNEPDWGQYVGASYAVNDGSHFLYNSVDASEAPDNEALFPPLCPFAEGSNDIAGIPSEVSILGAYPNPTSDKAIVQFSLFEAGSVSYDLYALDGTLVARTNHGNLPIGLHYASLDMASLDAGVYLLQLSVTSEMGLSSSNVRIVKQ